MNRISRIVATALTLAAGSAPADDIAIDPVAHGSLQTRTDVRAEPAAFDRLGVDPWSRSYDVRSEVTSPRSRAGGQAEPERARADGSVAALTGADSGAHGRRATLQGTLTRASQSLR